MDIWWKAFGTAITMALVVALARRAHRRVAGLVAGFPTVTAPALLWLASEQGPAFASAAAVATVTSCLVQAAFALGHARAARRLGPAQALCVGLAVASAPALLTMTVQAPLWLAAAVAALGVAACQALFPRPCRARTAAAPRPARLGGRWEVLVTVLGSAGLSALAAELGADWGPHAAGLLASLPVIGATVAVVEQGRHGPAAVGEFLEAYNRSLFGRILFGSLFALTVPAWGAAWALLLACVCGLLATAWLGRAGAGPAPGLAPR